MEWPTCQTLIDSVEARHIGGKAIASVGGQPNFTEGAAQAPRGKSIIGIRSLTKNGKSTIVLDLAGPVTTKGSNVSHVVTEWGMTPDLRRLQNPMDRVASIIRVAHPAHQPALIKQALERGLIDQQRAERLQRWTEARLRGAHPAFRKVMLDFALAHGQIDVAEHDRIIREQNLPVDLHQFGDIPMPQL